MPLNIAKLAPVLISRTDKYVTTRNRYTTSPIFTVCDILRRPCPTSAMIQYSALILQTRSATFTIILSGRCLSFEKYTTSHNTSDEVKRTIELCTIHRWNTACNVLTKGQWCTKLVEKGHRRKHILKYKPIIHLDAAMICYFYDSKDGTRHDL